MNIYLQIAAGLIPAFLILLIYTLAKRKTIVSKPLQIVKVVFGFVGVVGIASFLIVKGSGTSESRAASKIQDGEFVQIVYNMIKEDDSNSVKQAREYLDERYEDSLCTDDLVLCNARISAIEGELIKARMMYGKLSSPSKYKKEIECIENAWSDTEQNPENYDLPVIKDAIQKEIDKADSDVAEVADIIAETNLLYESSEETVDEARLNQLSDRIKSLNKKKPELFQIPDLRDSRLKVDLMKSDYQDIAANMDNYATLNELIVASELQMEKELSESDYSDSYSKEYGEKISQVKKALEKLVKKGDLIQNEADRVSATIANYELLENSGSLAHNIINLSNYASNDASDKSIASFEMSKLEYAIGNRDLSEKYFNNSINDVRYCKNDDFSAPINNIAALISENDNTEGFKNSGQYIEQANTAVTEFFNNPHVEAKSSDTYFKNNQEEKIVEDKVSYFDKLFENESDNNKDNNEENGGEDEENNNEENESYTEHYSDVVNQSFSSYYNDYISIKNASLNITKINPEKFETVEAYFNVESDYAYSPEELKSILSVYDCGEEITDFTITKKEFSQLNVILVCDVSGSMSGEKIENLRESVRSFISTSTNFERIGLITFNDGTVESISLTSNKTSLLTEVENISAGGGTDMYEPTLDAVSSMVNSDSSINVVFLLSDGEDNYPVDEADIRANIGLKAEKTGTIVYSLGLGSEVNSNYLSYYSNSTGGQYLYVSDSTTLQNFYTKLRNQVKNQYKITYNAEDTLTVTDRELNLSINTDNLCTSTKTYSLDENLVNSDVNIGISVNGLDQRLIVNPQNGTKVKLLGKGFKDSSSISITLSGGKTYYIKQIDYIDENTYELTLPDNIINATYDVKVSIDGRKKTLKKELTIANKLKEYVVGNYVFKSFTQSTDYNLNITTLSDYVIMNDWLSFKGPVSFEGNPSTDGSVIMRTSEICTVIFDGQKVKGIAKKFVKEGFSINIPAITEARLYTDTLNDYNEEPRESSFHADFVSLSGNINIRDLFVFVESGLYLLPNRLVFDTNNINPKFPYQDKLINLYERANGKPMMTFDFELLGYIGPEALSFKAEAEAKLSKNIQGSKYGKIGNALRLGIEDGASAKVKIDTINNEYGFAIENVSIPDLLNVGSEEGNEVSLELEFKATDSFDLYPSKVILGADFDVNTNIHGVPVTFSDFKIGFEDISKDNSGFNIANLKFEGGFDTSIKVVNLKQEIMTKYFGETKIISLDDTVVGFTLGKAHIEAETTLKVFDATLAKAKLKIGLYDYTNRILNITDQSCVGFDLKIEKLGMNIKRSYLTLVATADIESSMSSRFLGIDAIGRLDFDANLWVITKELLSGEGEIAIGILPYGSDYDNYAMFAIKMKAYTKSKGSTGTYIYLSFKNGFEYGKL